MKNNYQETHNTWNKIALLYEEHFMDLALYNDTYHQFCELLSKSNASILEIGCGPGNITRQLLALKPNLKILATDVSQNMVDLAQQNNPGITVQVLDCRDLEIFSEPFEGIVCGFTIPYLAKIDVSKLLANCAKLLTVDGILYLSFVIGNYEDSGFITGSSGDRTYFYYHDFQTIQQDIKLNNMVIIERSDKEYKKADGTLEIHTILMARKL